MSTCIAYLPNGNICGAPATILDPARGGMVCSACGIIEPLPVNPKDQEFVDEVRRTKADIHRSITYNPTTYRATIAGPIGIVKDKNECD